MSPYKLTWSAVLSLLLLCTGVYTSQAQELTVARYVDLSIARLQLARDTLQLEGRSPNTLEEQALCQRFGTTAGKYYAYAGTHQDEIAGYLAAHPAKQTEIDNLSAQLDALIAQSERR